MQEQSSEVFLSKRHGDYDSYSDYKRVRRQKQIKKYQLRKSLLGPKTKDVRNHTIQKIGYDESLSILWQCPSDRIDVSTLIPYLLIPRLFYESVDLFYTKIVNIFLLVSFVPICCQLATLHNFCPWFPVKQKFGLTYI